MTTRSGLIVPFNAPGTTSEGRVTIVRGAVVWPDDVTLVKLLLEHDQHGPVFGYAVELREAEDGIRGTFEFPLPDEPATAAALTSIDKRLRDGLSAGIDFDDATKMRVRRAQNGAVAGAGRLREVSLASVPAFEAARMDPA